MTDLSTSKNRKTTVRRDSDSELAERVRTLRSQLRLSQAEFAARLNVSRPQVGEWERGGDERPSFEKLLEMAALAPDREDRIWFWRKAGVNLEAIKADFREEVRSNTAPLADNEFLQFPIVSELKIRRNGEIEGSATKLLSVPVGAVAHPASVICLKATKNGPWAPQPGEIVLVDRSITDPILLRGKQVAVFFDPFPVCYESLKWNVPFAIDPDSSLFPATEFIDPRNSHQVEAIHRFLYPAGIGEQHLAVEAQHAHRMEEALRAGFLAGWLHRYSVPPGKSDSPANGAPWCWTLVTRVAFWPFQVQIALSPWLVDDTNSVEGGSAQERKLLDGLKIIGEIINWYAVQRPNAASE